MKMQEKGTIPINNNLIVSPQKFNTALEIDLFTMAIAETQLQFQLPKDISSQNMGNWKNQEYASIFTVKEFVKKMGLKPRKSLHRDLAKTAKKIVSAIISPPQQDKSIIYIPIFKFCQIKNGVITFQFNDLIGNLVMLTKQNFTKIDMLTIGSLRGKYAKRLYEITRKSQQDKSLLIGAKYKNKNTTPKAWQLTMSETQIRLTLGIDQKKYKNKFTLTGRVLKPAVDEINQSDACEFLIKFETVRKKDKWTFFCTTKPKTQSLTKENDEKPSKTRTYKNPKAINKGNDEKAKNATKQRNGRAPSAKQTIKTLADDGTPTAEFAPKGYYDDTKAKLNKTIARQKHEKA